MRIGSESQGKRGTNRTRGGGSGRGKGKSGPRPSSKRPEGGLKEQRKDEGKAGREERAGSLSSVIRSSLGKDVAQRTQKILPAMRKREILVRRTADKPSSYGTRPEDRSIELYLRLGSVNLDKPSGPTSHEVTSWVKKILGVDVAGHSGTLDPRVTGILPVMLGESRRVVEALLLAGKEYVCLMRLHRQMPKKAIIDVCSEFQGVIYQKPPLKSSVVKELRLREIYYLDILEIEDQRVLMRVGCEAGTYIRKLCFDIGMALGCGANMEELRRTRAGPFSENESMVTLHQLKDAFVAWQERGDEGPLRRAVVPVERALAHLPRLVVADGAVDAICHGAPLAAPGLISLETDINKGDVVAMFTLKGESVALGVAELGSLEMQASKEGVVVSTERVIMSPGTYPRRWKRDSGRA